MDKSIEKDEKYTPPCPLYRKCSGCQLQNLSYDRQLSYKQAKAIRLLGRFGHIDEIIGMDNPYHYRNKVQAAFAVKNKEVISGIYQSTSGAIVPCDSCFIEDEIADKIAVTVRQLAVSFKYKPYNPTNKTGFLRHVLIRRGFKSGQIMVVPVTADKPLRSERSFVNALLSRHPEITTIVQNINDSDTALFMGEKSNVLYGSGYIEEELLGMRFRISPQSFYQINPKQTEVLYSKAIEFAALTKDETLIDAYCGTGTIGILMSPHAKSVIGAELNSSAIADAEENAKLNKVDNISFHCGDAGAFMAQLAKDGKTADTVVTDPPRAGCSKEFLNSLIKLSPKKLVYISCNIETLARDMQYLLRKGYRAEKIQPVDMFPFTKHVECVVLMSRKAE